VNARAAFDEAYAKRLEMENTVSDNQVLVGSRISTLAKDIGNHVEDMNVWKVFFEAENYLWV